MRVRMLYAHYRLSLMCMLCGIVNVCLFVFLSFSVELIQRVYKEASERALASVIGM